MTFDFYDALRNAVDRAVDAGFNKDQLIYDLKAMIDEVEEADDIPDGANSNPLAHSIT